MKQFIGKRGKVECSLTHPYIKGGNVVLVFIISIDVQLEWSGFLLTINKVMLTF